MWGFLGVQGVARCGFLCPRIWRTCVDRGVSRLVATRELEGLVSVRAPISASPTGFGTTLSGRPSETTAGRSTTSILRRAGCLTRGTDSRDRWAGIPTRSRSLSLMDSSSTAGTIDLCGIDIIQLFFGRLEMGVNFILCILCQRLLVGKCVYFDCCFCSVGCSQVGRVAVVGWPNEPIVHLQNFGCFHCATTTGCGRSALCAACHCCNPEFLRNYSVWCLVTIKQVIYTISQLAGRPSLTKNRGGERLPTDIFAEQLLIINCFFGYYTSNQKISRHRYHSLLDDSPKVFVKVGRFKQFVGCELFFFFVFVGLDFQGGLESIDGGVPAEPDEVGVSKDRMFVVLKPLFCFWIAWIAASQLAFEFQVMMDLQSCYLNFHPLMIRSLVTLAQMLDALTTLWSRSAFGWTITYFTTDAQAISPSLSRLAYLVGSPTVSAQIFVILKPAARAYRQSSSAELWLIWLRLLCQCQFFIEVEMYSAVSSFVLQKTSFPRSKSITSRRFSLCSSVRTLLSLKPRELSSCLRWMGHQRAEQIMDPKTGPLPASSIPSQKSTVLMCSGVYQSQYFLRMSTAFSRYLFIIKEYKLKRVTWLIFENEIILFVNSMTESVIMTDYSLLIQLIIQVQISFRLKILYLDECGEKAEGQWFGR